MTIAAPAFPIRYRPDLEQPEPDEAEVTRHIIAQFDKIEGTVFKDSGHAERGVHAKPHGYLRVTFEVLDGLSPHLAQGLYAAPATYDAILRFSTTPGDVLDDAVSTPRGVALKVLDVPGARLPGSEGDRTQNYVFGNSPTFQVATAAKFLQQLEPMAATTGRAEPLKHAISVLSRNAEAALEMVGGKSATLTTLAGQAPTELLGDSFYSQAALLHGDYYAKLAMSPVSPELTALSRQKLDLSGHPDAIRDSVREYFRSLPGAWELRVQVGTDIDAMPIEDAKTEWPEDRSPYVAVARITARPQDSWSDDLRDLVEEHLAFDPWIGLAAHRPLGSIMRARRPAYAAARHYRDESNGAEIREPEGRPAA